MTRVQIPAYTDRWMMGDRFGEIVKTSVREYKTTRPYLGKTTHEREIAHVKLDKSGKTVRVILDDCTVYDDDRDRRMVAAYVAEGLGE